MYNMSNVIKVGFIGAGNMATSILNGIIQKNLIDPANIYISDIDTNRLCTISDSYHVHTTTDNLEVIQCSQIIILAIKPNVCTSVLNEIKNDIGTEKILLSIIAGWSTFHLKEYLLPGTKVIRIMPNMPALVNEGMTAICANKDISSDMFMFVTSIFKVLGKVEIVNEQWMDGITAVSGSGPAYVYMFIEALADAAVLQGVPRSVSYTLAAQTVLGAAYMVLSTGKHPGELKDAVCSPGGTTIEAVYALEKGGFRAAVMNAVEVCALKSKSLSEK